MARRGGGGRASTGGPRTDAPPIPLDPVDLLAGLAPGVELAAGELPAGVAGADAPTAVTVTVNEVGRLLRSGDPVIRRLIRTPMIEPREDEPAAAQRAEHDPDKPGE